MPPDRVRVVSGPVELHSALRSSETSPNLRMNLASPKSPVAGSPVRKATAPTERSGFRRAGGLASGRCPSTLIASSASPTLTDNHHRNTRGRHAGPHTHPESEGFESCNRMGKTLMNGLAKDRMRSIPHYGAKASRGMRCTARVEERNSTPGCIPLLKPGRLPRRFPWKNVVLLQSRKRLISDWYGQCPRPMIQMKPVT